MKTKFFLFAILMTVAVTLALAQGRRGQQAGAESTAQREAQKPRTAREKQEATKTDTRQKLHATEKQGQQFQACFQATGRVREQAREIVRTAVPAGFNLREVRQIREQLRKVISALHQEHVRFRSGLNSEQKNKLQDHFLAIERYRGELNTHMQEINRELARSKPDHRQVVHGGREIQDLMGSWQSQYRGMSGHLNVRPEA